MNTYTSIPKNRIFILLFLLSFTSLTGAFSVSAQTEPPLSIIKSGPITTVPGELITYEITYQNQSAFIQKDVVITDIIDLSNATYVSSNPTAIEDYTSVNGKLILTWDKTKIPSLENLNAGENVIFVTIKAGVVMNDKDINLTVKPNYAPGEFYLNTASNATNPILNFATISSEYYNGDNELKTFTTTSTPPVSTNITQNCSFTFNDAIGQIKSSTNTVFMYLVSITNTGNIWNKWDLSGYSTILKGNAPLVSFNDINGNPITSTVGWTAPGATTTFYLILTADQGTNPNQWANTFVTASSQVECAADVTTRFDTYICGGNCGSYELMYTYKFDHQDPVQSGSTITYTIVVQNSSDAILSNVVLTESYPTFTSFLSSTPPLHNGTPISYTLNTSNNQWSFVNLPIGMTTFDVTLQLNEDIPNNTVLTNLLTLILRLPVVGTTQQGSVG